MFFNFLEGRVPWVRWAWVHRRFGHSAWRASQAAPLVKGSLAVPDSMLWTNARRTTESSVRWTKLQTWQVGLSHSGALLLAKSEGKIAAPATWRTEAWYLLTVERKVATRGLEENSPPHNFLKDCTKGCCQWGYRLLFSTVWCKGWSVLL